MQCEHWIVIAKFRHEKLFADSRWRKKYCSLKQLHKQMLPAQLPSRRSAFGFYTIHSNFHRFKIYQEEITGVQDWNVLAFLSNYM